jgi:hypothetical protein
VHHPLEPIESVGGIRAWYLRSQPGGEHNNRIVFMECRKVQKMTEQLFRFGSGEPDTLANRSCLWQLGDVAGNAPSFIETQSLSDLSIARIGVAVDICESLSVRVYDLEAAV